MSIPTPTHQLARVPLFANLPTLLLDELVRAGRVRQYPAGQILCIEGDPGDHLIVLEAGQLRISRVTPLGDEVVLAVVDAPAAVGELALLDGAPRDATVTAQRAVTVRLVPRSTFLALLKREPLAVEGLLRTLAGLVRAGNARHADVVGLDVPGRLAKWLLRHAQQGQTGTVLDGTTVVMQCSQGELAAELGTTRSTLNRALHGFEDRQLITMAGNRITLHKPEELRFYTS
jgi:CRP-like cAMP-binding protein